MMLKILVFSAFKHAEASNTVISIQFGTENLHQINILGNTISVQVLNNRVENVIVPVQ